MHSIDQLAHLCTVFGVWISDPHDKEDAEAESEVDEKPLHKAPFKFACLVLDVLFNVITFEFKWAV